MHTHDEQIKPFLKSMAYAISLLSGLILYVKVFETSSLTSVMLLISFAVITGLMTESFESTNHAKKKLTTAMIVFVAILFGILYNAKSIDKYYYSDSMENVRAAKCLVGLSYSGQSSNKQRKLECIFNNK